MRNDRPHEHAHVGKVGTGWGEWLKICNFESKRKRLDKQKMTCLVKENVQRVTLSDSREKYHPSYVHRRTRLFLRNNAVKIGVWWYMERGERCKSKSKVSRKKRARVFSIRRRNVFFRLHHRHHDFLFLSAISYAHPTNTSTHLNDKKIESRDARAESSLTSGEKKFT